jgi:hypothetical protein
MRTHIHIRYVFNNICVPVAPKATNTAQIPEHEPPKQSLEATLSAQPLSIIMLCETGNESSIPFETKFSCAFEGVAGHGHM